MSDTNNSIMLTGRVLGSPEYSHCIYGEAFYRLSMSARRLSGTEDMIPVTVSERLLGGMPVEPGMTFDIDGQIRSYNQHSENGNKLLITVFAREFVPVPNDEVTEDRNEVELSGYVCKPVIYRMTPFSREISDILLAVNRRYGKSDYLPCIAWGRNARFVKELRVGDNIRLFGRLQSREYKKAFPDGSVEARTAYEISCSAIELLHD